MMLLALSYGIAVATIVILMILLWKVLNRIQNPMTENLFRLMMKQQEQIQSLTNLATAKDLTTFQNLEATRRLPNQSPSEPIHPLDDASMARRLAEQYASSGIDPAHAYAQDEENPLADFGGIESIRTY